MKTIFLLVLLILIVIFIFIYKSFISKNTSSRMMKKILRYLTNTILFVVIWCIPAFLFVGLSLSVNGTRPSAIAGVGGIAAILISYALVKRINKSNLWSRLFDEAQELNDGEKFDLFNKNSIKKSIYNWMEIFVAWLTSPAVTASKVEKIDSLESKIRDWILNRKKNITISLILIPFLKVLTHYLWFPETKKIIVNAFQNNRTRKGYTTVKEDIRETFGYHLDVIFSDRLELFFAIIIIFLVFVWFFNDKIKAQ